MSFGIQWYSLLDHLRWVFWECSCVGYVGPPFLSESWSFLAHLFVRSNFRLADCESQPYPWHMTCWQIVSLWSRISLNKVCSLLKSSLGCVACEAYWNIFCCYLNLSSECVGPGPVGRDSGSYHYKTLLVTGPGQPVWMYQWSNVPVIPVIVYVPVYQW